MGMVRIISPRASRAQDVATELLNRCRILRIIDRHGDRHKWRFRSSDLIEITGSLFDAKGLGFKQSEVAGCIEIETDASAAEVIARVLNAARAFGRLR